MDDYDTIYADYLASVVQSTYLRIGVRIVAKPAGAIVENPPSETSGTENGNDPLGGGPLVGGTNGATGGTNGTAVLPNPLPSGFRRLSDLRKRAPKASYDDLKSWVGKTIRLDGVNFKTEERDGKTVIVSGEMSFSEFDPSNPEREVSDEMVTTTAIPRGAIRSLYEGLTKNPDETIVCDVVQSKRGLALQ